MCVNCLSIIVRDAMLILQPQARACQVYREPRFLSGGKPQSRMFRQISTRLLELAVERAAGIDRENAFTKVLCLPACSLL